jgi:hypothetical protein
MACSSNASIWFYPGREEIRELPLQSSGVFGTDLSGMPKVRLWGDTPLSFLRLFPAPIHLSLKSVVLRRMTRRIRR